MGSKSHPSSFTVQKAKKYSFTRQDVYRPSYCTYEVLLPSTALAYDFPQMTARPFNLFLFCKCAIPFGVILLRGLHGAAPLLIKDLMEQRENCAPPWHAAKEISTVRWDAMDACSTTRNAFPRMAARTAQRLIEGDYSFGPFFSSFATHNHSCFYCSIRTHSMFYHQRVNNQPTSPVDCSTILDRGKVGGISW